MIYILLKKYPEKDCSKNFPGEILIVYLTKLAEWEDTIVHTVSTTGFSLSKFLE